MSDWIKWRGEGPPVDGDVVVEVVLTSGEQIKPRRADAFYWKRMGIGDDIDVYRVVRAPESPVKADPLPPELGITQGQVDGRHYADLGEYQPIEVLKRWLTPEEFRGWVKGEAIVYLARERQKGGDKDLQKADHILRYGMQLLGIA